MIVNILNVFSPQKFVLVFISPIIHVLSDDFLPRARLNGHP